MIQEIYQSEKSTPKRDLLLVFVLLVLFIMARYISVGLRALPYGGLWQLLAFALLLSFVYYIYKTRLISFRYTLFVDAYDKEKSEAYGEEVPYPYPPGTLLIERMSGSRGRLMEAVAAEEMAAFCVPGDENAPAVEKKRELHLSSQPKKRARQLCYRRGGEMYRLYFSPSDAMAARLEAILGEKAER